MIEPVMRATEDAKSLQTYVFGETCRPQTGLRLFSHLTPCSRMELNSVARKRAKPDPAGRRRPKPGFQTVSVPLCLGASVVK